MSLLTDIYFLFSLADDDHISALDDLVISEFDKLSNEYK